MKVKDYKELKVWQQGIEIVDKIYSITDNFPKDELYGLTNQMRRSALSIPSNISEGFVRNHSKEYIQFLHISLGSCADLETQIIIAQKRKYVAQDKFDELIKDINYEMRMLVSMIKAVQRNL